MTFFELVVPSFYLQAAYKKLSCFTLEHISAVTYKKSVYKVFLNAITIPHFQKLFYQFNKKNQSFLLDWFFFDQI